MAKMKRFNGNTRNRQRMSSSYVLADRPTRKTKRDGSRTKQMADIVKLDNNRIVQIYYICHVIDTLEIEVTEDKNKKIQSSKVLRTLKTETSWEFIFKLTELVGIVEKTGKPVQIVKDSLPLTTVAILPKSVEEDALIFWLETNHAGAWAKEVLVQARTLSRNRNSIAPTLGR